MIEINISSFSFVPLKIKSNIKGKGEVFYPCFKLKLNFRLKGKGEVNFSLVMKSFI